MALGAMSREADRPAAQSQFRLAVGLLLRGAKLLRLSTCEASDDLAQQRRMQATVQVEGRLAPEIQCAQLSGGALETATVVPLFGSIDPGFRIGS